MGVIGGASYCTCLLLHQVAAADVASSKLDEQAQSGAKVRTTAGGVSTSSLGAMFARHASDLVSHYGRQRSIPLELEMECANAAGA